MPSTSPAKIDYRYPVSAEEKGDKPDSCVYSKEGFVRYFRKLAGTDKPFNVECVRHYGRSVGTAPKKLTRIELVLNDSGSMSKSAAAEFIAENAPEVFPSIANFERVSNIRTALTLDNLFDAWRDVCRRIHFLNRGDFKKVSDVEETILKNYRLEFNMSENSMSFDATLFKKMAERVYPDIDKIEDVDERGKLNGMLLQDLSNSKPEILKIITSEFVRNGKSMQALVKESQVQDIVKQAKRCYISYTPAEQTKSGKAEYRFSSISEGKNVPGRIGKLDVEGAKTEYIPYKRVPGLGAVYDRTLNQDGVAFRATETSKAAPAKPDENGFYARTIKVSVKTPLTADQMAIVDQVKKKFSGVPGLKLPKTDHGLYEWGLKAKSKGSL